jgi:hypothetical protein
MSKTLRTRWLQLRSLLAPTPVAVADLSHPQPERRWQAVRALAGQPHLRYQAALLALLDDPDPIVRDEAAANYFPDQPVRVLGRLRVGGYSADGSILGLYRMEGDNLYGPRRQSPVAPAAGG